MSTSPYGADVWSDELFTLVGSGSGPMSPSGLSTSFESEAAREWSVRLVELIRLRSLPDDWDGEGAHAPKPEVVDSIEALFGALGHQDYPPPTRIVASHDGDIIVEWQLGGGAHVEMECSTPYRATWMYRFPNQPIIHEETAWGPTAVERRYEDLYHAA